MNYLDALEVNAKKYVLYLLAMILQALNAKGDLITLVAGNSL